MLCTRGQRGKCPTSSSFKRGLSSNFCPAPALARMKKRYLIILNYKNQREFKIIVRDLKVWGILARASGGYAIEKRLSWAVFCGVLYQDNSIIFSSVTFHLPLKSWNENFGMFHL